MGAAENFIATAKSRPLGEGGSAAFCESAALGAGACSPERADFPRPGEDVTAGDKKGNLSRSD